MKQVIVTGAGKGLGKAIALELANQGFHILALDVDRESLEALQSILKGSVETTYLDITIEDQVSRFFEGISPYNLYGLINNAGIYLGKNLLSYSASDVSRILNVNLAGAIHCTKHFAKRIFLKDDSNMNQGVIVNMSSSSIYGGSDPVYSATKAAMIGFTKSCALQFSPTLRVNAIAPGIVETELLKAIPETSMNRYRNNELVKLPILPSDVANTVTFLLKESGRNYSGAVFDLNNGFHL